MRRAVVGRTMMGRTVVMRRTPLHLRGEVGRRARATGSGNDRHRLRALDEVHGDDSDRGGGDGFLSQT